MPFYANSIPAVALATRTTSGNGLGLNTGEYYEGHIYTYVSGLAAGGRVTPRWEGSPNGAFGATSGNYVTLRAYATSLRATGLAVLTLPVIGQWGRIAWSVGGATGIKFACWFVGRGST